MLEKSVFEENKKNLKKIVSVQRISFGSEPRRRQYWPELTSRCGQPAVSTVQWETKNCISSQKLLYFSMFFWSFPCNFSQIDSLLIRMHQRERLWQLRTSEKPVWPDFLDPEWSWMDSYRFQNSSYIDCSVEQRGGSSLLDFGWEETVQQFVNPTG